MPTSLTGKPAVEALVNAPIYLTNSPWLRIASKRA